MMQSILKKLTCVIALLVFVSAVQAQTFSGPRKCGACHKEEHAAWKESSHAMAFSDEIFQHAWEEGGSEFSCLRCHATGADLETETYAHPGVTCESCHGIMKKGHSKDDIEMDLPVIESLHSASEIPAIKRQAQMLAERLDVPVYYIPSGARTF